MSFGSSSWMLLLCLLTPMIGFLSVVFVWSWRMKQRSGRSPVSEKLLRPAGESLRLKIEELGDWLGLHIALTIAIPGAAMAFVLLVPSADDLSRARVISAFILCAVLLACCLWIVILTAKKLRHYRLGFHGERAVAEEINQLMREGCRVFHDVPMEPYGNIDHAIVSPAGVFAVETKTRRKRKAPDGKEAHKAVFDGEAVVFPTRRELDMVNQAKRQGDHLRAFLTKAVGEPVPVVPILTLPGWFVTSSVRATSVHVLNPRAIKSLATDSRAAKLSPQMIQRIAHQLEQKCRDVEL